MRYPDSVFIGRVPWGITTSARGHLLVDCDVSLEDRSRLHSIFVSRRLARIRKEQLSFENTGINIGCWTILVSWCHARTAKTDRRFRSSRCWEEYRCGWSLREAEACSPISCVFGKYKGSHLRQSYWGPPPPKNRSGLSHHFLLCPQAFLESEAVAVHFKDVAPVGEPVK
jgi:hypothetical protein